MPSRKPLYFFWIELDGIDGYTYSKFFSRLRRVAAIYEEHIYRTYVGKGLQTQICRVELLVATYDPRRLKIRLGTLNNHTSSTIVLKRIEQKANL